jgi:hypothetical protein
MRPQLVRAIRLMGAAQREFWNSRSNSPALARRRGRSGQAGSANARSATAGKPCTSPGAFIVRLVSLRAAASGRRCGFRTTVLATRLRRAAVGLPPSSPVTGLWRDKTARRSAEATSDSSKQSCSEFCDAPAGGGGFSDAPFVWVSIPWNSAGWPSSRPGGTGLRQAYGWQATRLRPLGFSRRPFDHAQGYG